MAVAAGAGAGDGSDSSNLPSTLPRLVSPRLLSHDHFDDIISVLAGDSNGGPTDADADADVDLEKVTGSDPQFIEMEVVEMKEEEHMVLNRLYRALSGANETDGITAQEMTVESTYSVELPEDSEEEDNVVEAAIQSAHANYQSTGRVSVEALISPLSPSFRREASNRAETS